MDHNFREFFDYMNLQVQALSELQKQHIRIKTDYEKYGLELIQSKRKQKTDKRKCPKSKGQRRKKTNSWELSEEDSKNVEALKQNKESAFKAMLPGMTNLVSAQKVQMACSCSILKKEYERFIKKQGNNLKEYLLSLKDKNQNIISDAYILCSLFNIELQKLFKRYY